MDRINTSTKAVDLFGTGKHGFRDGNLATGVYPTDFEAAFFNAFQEEFVAGLIEYTGQTPSGSDYSQIRKAILILIAKMTGNDYKASVRYATTANVTLNGLATQAGGDWPAALTAGDRILTNQQTTAADRVIWIASAGAWTRATDADEVGELTSGAIVVVEDGTTLADSIWMLTTDGSIVPGTTSLSWARKDAGAASGSGKLPTVSATVVANALTVTIGAESLDFRSTTLTSGVPVTRTASAQGSLMVPNGATLGTVSGQASRLIWGWLDNAGTLEPFICNLAGGLNLDETTLISTTAISAAATVSNVIYSATARSNVAFRLRGFCDISEAAAGTWATAPTLVQPIGGQALTAMSSLGYGQAYTVYYTAGSGSGRAIGGTYYNGSGRTRFVLLTAAGQNSQISFLVNGNRIGMATCANAASGSGSTAFVVPAGCFYSTSVFTGSPSIYDWSELG